MYQIINDGAVIRIENGTKTLLVTKEQVKTIDTIQGNIVRIDIGEGPLRNIFINAQEVTNPAVASANELREIIRAMLLSDQYEGGDATEATQIAILQEIQQMKLLSSDIVMNLTRTNITDLEPIFVDESNPNTIYKGWARTVYNTSAPVWAIQKISRTRDLVVHEWADGDQFYDNVWDDRLQLNYSPYLSHRISE